ncbi:ankyrin repeat, PH and SEC7 domain containing protein [Salix suchowensis]|nr:ankyrin repeat, PH and SEC7 domain containing protein [Salix suchowensis]
MGSVAINMDENSIPREHIASLMIDSQLHKCVRQDNIDDFKSRVQTLSAEELVTPTGNSLLHVAVSYGSDKITSYLAETFPSLITTQNSQEDTVLHLAARRGKHSDAIKSLAQSNPSLMRKANTKGNTPLHDAVINGYEEIARFLGSKDPEVVYYNNNNGKSPLYLAVENDKNKNGRSPLYLAVEKGSKNGILDDLLKSGASIPIKIEDGDALPKRKSPVHAAIEQRDKDILVRIEKAKPELLRLTDEELGNSLHYASSIGFLKGVQFLLDKFLDGAYEINREENYPIHIACKNDSVGVVKEYLDRFPYPEEFLNKKGQNILHVAAKYGNDRVVSYILRQEDRLVKSLLNEMDEDGNTPLHLAACYGRPNSSFLLVRDNRVGRFIVNNRNWTPFDLAEQESKSAMTTLSILYFYACPKKSLREYFTVTPRHISQAKEESKNRIENLLVVAVLVAGVTFAGAVQLPQLRDYNNSREHHHESNSTITASHYRSYENHLCGYLFLDLGAFSASMVASLILLWANFNDVRFILLGVQFAANMVFYSIIMMFGAFFLSVRIALLGSPEVWLTIAIIVVAVVFFLVQAFLFWPLFLPSPVDQIVEEILLNYFYYLSFFTLFYSWRWLTENLKKKLKHTREQREK